MWRPVNAKRTHGIGLGGMHSTGRLPSSTVPASESTNRASFESELVKRQHKLAHAREIRRAIRAKLKKKEQLDTSTNFLQRNPSEKDDMLPEPSRKRWRTESNHQHGAGHKRLKRDDNCHRDSSTDEESESESDMTSSNSENTDGSVLSSDELDDEEDDTLTEEDTKLDSQEEDDELDEEDDRILAAEEEALHRLTSKSSKLRSEKRLLKKQQRSTRNKSTEDQHRGCGLVSTPNEEDPLGEGRRRRRRRRYRRRYRRQYPIKRIYRRSRRRRRPRCSLTPRRRYRRRHYWARCVIFV